MSKTSSSIVLTIYSLCQTFVGILICAVGIYLMNQESVTDFSKIAFGLGVIYLAIGLFGFIILRFRFLLPIYMIILVLFFMWELALFCMYVFWENKFHKHVRKLEGGDSATVNKALDFLEDNTLLVQIVSAVLAFSTLSAIFAARGYSTPTKSEETMYAE